MVIQNEEIVKAFPEVEWIKDPELKEKVVRIWKKACEESPHESIYQGIFNKSYDPEADFRDGLVYHTRLVTQLAYQAAKVNNELEEKQVNLDYIVAGALLHDVCKIVEKGVGGASTPWGKHITHGVYSIILAKEEDLPLEILHMICAHTVNLNMQTKTTEAAILHHCDYMASDITHIKHGRLSMGRTIKE